MKALTHRSRQPLHSSSDEAEHRLAAPQIIGMDQEPLTCIMSVGALILDTSLMLGKMSSHEGQRVQVGFMTRMPVARGLCSMTPARPGTLDPRSQVGPVPTL